MKKRLFFFLAGLFVAASIQRTAAGPVLDDILNYMFLDQSVAMKGPEELFDVQRTVALTRETPVGQTFVTGPETETVVRVRVFLHAGPDWQKGEGAEMVLWDSPARKVSHGRYTIAYEFRGFQFHQAEFEINARVKPNTSYYFEISYVGEGDGTLGKVGAMKGRDAYKPGQGFLAGKEADFDLCFQTHSRRAPNRVGGLQKMFARFDLARPELAETKKAVEAQDFETAIARTVAHFEARKKPIAIIDPANVPKYDPDFDTSKADLALRNYFDASDSGAGYAGPDLNWRAEPDFDAQGRKLATSFDLNRFGPRGTLTNAYLKTGNEKYAKKFNDMMVDWFLDNPPPPVSHIGGNPWDVVWASLNTGIRLGHGFTAYSRVHASPHFTTDCRMAFILSMADHADTLRMVGGNAGGNWSFTQNSSLLRFALDFPEFANSKLWFDTACERLDASIKKDWLPDGVEMESAPGYQRMAYEPLAGISELVRERGVTTPFAEGLRARLEKQAEYFMHIAMPDGITPFLGDWGHGQERPALLKDARRYGRADMLYVGSVGKEGTPPTELSKLYPYAGVVTMRSDWGDADRPFEDARYLMLHGLHYGAHGHADLNGITLYAYGRELLTDPGSHVYGSPEHAFLNTAVSHNLMTLDGQDQNRRGATAFRNWAATPIADYLASWGAVYRAGDYLREVFFVRANGDPGARDYWVVRDTAQGAGTHALEQRWHFGLGSTVKVDRATSTACTTFEDKGNLAILQVDPTRLALEETTADTWHPRGVAREPQKLPTLIYKTKAALPAAMNTILFPFDGQSGPTLTPAVLERSADGLECAFKLAQGKTEDLFVFGKSGGRRTVAGEKLETDAERVFVRRVGGRLRSVLLVKGTALRIDGREIVAGETPLLSAAVLFEDSRVIVYVGRGTPTLKLPAAQGREVIVREQEVDGLLNPPRETAGRATRKK